MASNFLRNQRNNRRTRRHAAAALRRARRTAPRIVRRVHSVEDSQHRQLAGTETRRRFENAGVPPVPVNRPLIERLPARFLNTLWLSVLVALMVVEATFIVAESASWGGLALKTASDWIVVGLMGFLLYANLFFVKLHPLSEATAANDAAEDESTHRQTLRTLRKARLAGILYVITVVAVMAVSLHQENTRAAELKTSRDELAKTTDLLRSTNGLLNYSSETTSDPAAASTPVTTEDKAGGAMTTGQSVNAALAWLMTFLFGGIRGWLLMGHAALLFLPLRLGMAAPANYEQALEQEQAASRRLLRAVRRARPLVLKADQTRQAGEEALWNLISPHLKPSTVALMDEHWNRAVPMPTPAPATVPQETPVPVPDAQPPPAEENARAFAAAGAGAGAMPQAAPAAWDDVI